MDLNVGPRLCFRAVPYRDVFNEEILRGRPLLDLDSWLTHEIFSFCYRLAGIGELTKQ